MSRPLLRWLISIECLASGLLGLYVGLDYVSRIAVLRRFNGGYDFFHALSADGSPLELLQDYGGARALLFGGNSYALNGAFVDEYASHFGNALGWTTSTHPPTAFLFMLPLAPLSFGLASAVWAVLVIAGLVLTVRAAGASLYAAAVLGPLLMLLPPVATAFSHLGIPWLVLVFLAYRFRDRPGISGALIAAASLTKYLPSLLLMPFILSRRWRALATFVGVWAAALLTVALLNADAFRQYLDVGRDAAAPWLIEQSNGSLVLFAMRHGEAATALAVLLVGMVVVLDLIVGAYDMPQRWARWNWVSIALLPITWTFSVLPLALSVLILVQRRRVAPALIGIAAFAPVIFSLDQSSAIPPVVCTACVGAALVLDATIALAAAPKRFRPMAGFTADPLIR